MVRAPICTSSQCSATRATAASLVASETTARPNASATRRSSGRPSSPRPWKAYGEVRGLNAPPRSRRAPAWCAAAAAATRSGSFSTAHGPSIRVHSSPPTAMAPAGVSMVTGPRAADTRGLGSSAARIDSTASSAARRARVASSKGACGPTTSTAMRPGPLTRRDAGAGAGQRRFDGARLGGGRARAQEHDHRSASRSSQRLHDRAGGEGEAHPAVEIEERLVDARQIRGRRRCAARTRAWRR